MIRDYDLADPGIFSPCSTSVQVCEGFAPFIRGDTGIAASFAVLVRTFEIVSAIDPTQKPGFFYKAFKNTMNKFCSDLPKTEMVRYIAVDPVKPEFEVYEDRPVYMGLPEALLGDGNVVDPEVGVFLCKGLSQWSGFGIQREKRGFLLTPFLCL